MSEQWENFQGCQKPSFLFPALFVSAFGGIVKSLAELTRLVRGSKDATASQNIPTHNPGHL